MRWPAPSSARGAQEAEVCRGRLLSASQFGLEFLLASAGARPGPGPGRPIAPRRSPSVGAAPLAGVLLDSRASTRGAVLGALAASAGQ